jgi:hypothetical protein
VFPELSCHSPTRSLAESPLLCSEPITTMEN